MPQGGIRPIVPGDVHLDLLRNKLIPDPYYRENEAKLQWIENASWEYRTTIDATPELLNVATSSWCSTASTVTPMSISTAS